MKIPWQSLSKPALDGLIEEFVSREGTEYGFEDVDMDTKVRQVLSQLQAGKAGVFYDDESGTTSIMPLEEFR